MECEASLMEFHHRIILPWVHVYMMCWCTYTMLMVFSHSIAIISDQAAAACCCTIPLRFPTSLSTALTANVIVSMISSKLVIAFPPIGNVSIACSNSPISTVQFPNTRYLLRTKSCLEAASCLPPTNCSTSFRSVPKTDVKFPIIWKILSML